LADVAGWLHLKSMAMSRARDGLLLTISTQNPLFMTGYDCNMTDLTVTAFYRINKSKTIHTAQREKIWSRNDK
jgi:hypothetical protein